LIKNGLHLHLKAPPNPCGDFVGTLKPLPPY
jgi:hypothetical protein